MNMKKTIAAVAACAMAVSAMATTVSAVDENATEAKSAHYDLTIKSKVKTADLTFTLVKTAVAGDEIHIYIPYAVASSIPADVTVTAGTKSFKFTTNSYSSDYDGAASCTDGDVNSDGTYDYFDYKIDLTTGNGKALAALVQDEEAAENFTITITMNGLTVLVDQAALNSALVDGAETQTYVDGDITCTDTTLNFNGRGAVKETEIKKPMKSIANTNSKTAEVFTVLGTTGSKSVDSSYVNVPAVVNDMVANYDDVVFTFNTATDNVLTKNVLDANDKAGSWYTNDVMRQYTDYYVTGVPTADTWMGDSTFKSFPQHLYNLFGDEGTGYTYSDSYTFNNLFNAALVANNNYTMNQSTVTPFEYSKTSVSFSWSDLTGGNSFVSPASAVQTLQLATSSDWYWDSLDVTAYTLAADDASTDAGAEDDGEDLDAADDEAADDTVADDDVTDDDVADDVADDDVADDDVAADDTVADETTDANPATGNAPIALAVIPVALAAAAVVAKKRG